MSTSAPNKVATLKLELPELAEIIAALHIMPSANPDLLAYLYNKRRNLETRTHVRQKEEAHESA